MKALHERILRDGRCLPGGVLKVDSFINHQMDPRLMQAMAAEFARRFAGAGVNKVLTIEASGIAPAILVGCQLDVPVVFAKKKRPATLEHMLTTQVYSFTKRATYDVCLSRDFLTPADRVLFIDDFLANGAALMGLSKLVEDAGATLVGAGIVIEKAFQPGGDMIRARGIRLESLARVKSMNEETGVEFVD